MQEFITTSNTVGNIDSMITTLDNFEKELNESENELFKSIELDKERILEIETALVPKEAAIEDVPMEKDSVSACLIKNETLLCFSKPVKLSDKQIMELTPHELTNVFPGRSDLEYMALSDDVNKNGCLKPIYITRDLKIIDGRERVKILQSNIQSNNDGAIHLPTFIYVDGNDEDILGLIMSLNNNQRELTKSQKAAAAVKYYEILKQNNKEIISKKMSEIRKNSTTKEIEEKIDSRAQAALAFRISSAYLGKAAELRDFSLELFTKVFEGKISLDKAHKLMKKSLEEHSENEQAEDSLESILDGFVDKYGTNKNAAFITIGFLTKLGINCQTAQNAVVHTIKKEQKKNEEWINQSDDAKFKFYLKDFTESMRRHLNDANKFKLFKLRINDGKTDQTFEKLEHKIAYLKGICTKNEIDILDISMKAVDASMTEVQDDNVFETILARFVASLSGEIK